MDKLKVLEVTDAFYPAVDGVVRVVDNYAEQLSDITDCTVLAPAPAKKSKYKDKAKYNVIRYGSTPAPEGYRMAVPLFNRRVEKKILAEKYDIIHIHSPFTLGRIAHRLAKKSSTPTVITLHTKYKQDFERALGRKNPLVKFMMHFIMKSYHMADSVWTVSHEAENILRDYGYKGEVEVVRNATDFTYPDDAEDKIDAINKLHGLYGQKNVFIFVGRMAIYKGLKILCESLEIVKNLGKDFRMIFVGGGFDLDKLKKYAETRGIEKWCIFVGTVFDKQLLQAYYLRADLLIFPSTFDTSGVVKVEAAAHKKATVLIRNTCSAEEVVDGENGFLCDATVESLANKIFELCDNEELVKRVGENAYKTLYHTWADVSREILSKYQSVIEKKKVEIERERTNGKKKKNKK